VTELKQSANFLKYEIDFMHHPHHDDFMHASSPRRNQFHVTLRFSQS